jgi:hypothetical protein
VSTPAPTPSETVAAAARAFGAQFADAHPDLPPIGIGAVAAVAWLDADGVGWAARVAASSAHLARSATVHPDRFLGADAPRAVRLVCGRCGKAFRGPLWLVRPALEDHELDAHYS